MLSLLAFAAAAPLPLPAEAPPVEVRALAGALIEKQSHGEMDLGVRAGPWSAELYTDTLQLQWAPELKKGRAWVTLRGAGFASGLMITPWIGDEPAPGMALVAWSVGPDLGAVRHLPGGLWLGGGAGVKLLGFAPMADTVVPVPGVWLHGGPSLAAGWWTRMATVQVRGGVDFATEVVDAPGDDQWGRHGPVGDAVEPWIEGEATFRPRWIVAPRVELRGGTSAGRGAATAFRIGGSMPYQVPLVGYGWSRLWAESYGAGRLALLVGDADAAPGSGVGAQPVKPTERVVVRGGVVADVVLSQGIDGFPGCDPESWDACDLRMTTTRSDLGVGGQLALRYRRSWLQVEGGYGLGSGQVGLDAATLMVRLGVDWVPLKKRERQP